MLMNVKTVLDTTMYYWYSIVRYLCHFIFDENPDIGRLYVWLFLHVNTLYMDERLPQCSIDITQTFIQHS